MVGDVKDGTAQHPKLRENGSMSFDRTLDESALFRICFVCTGNICRSPMAEVVFQELVRKAGYEGAVTVISAGTGDWHVGENSDDRTIAALAAKGYDGSRHRARQFDPEWFESLDLVVVFDRSQERILRAWATTDEDRGKVQLLLSFDQEQAAQADVPDPYYSNAAMFDTVLAMIERSSAALFRQIEPGIRQGVS
ncbi:MAG: protein tyrosine phosphatase [Microbacteriaceae bacterium]|nr:protein tyrosine phosphatase [Microbacteriaceae bacterium]